MISLQKYLNLLLVLALISSCNQSKKNNTKPNSESNDFLNSSKEQAHQINLNEIDTTYIYDKIKYNLNDGKKFEIINSYPKGVTDYIDKRGNKLSYVVFWTLLSNQADSAIDIDLTFSSDSLILNSSPQTYLKLFIPKESPAPSKLSAFDYGLMNLKSYLDNHFGQFTALRKVIYPKQSQMFYVVALFNKRINGVIRSGLYLDDSKLIYHINGLKYNAGSLNLKRQISSKLKN